MNGDSKTVVLCAGLNRSGSTWQLNAARELFHAARPGVEIYVSWIRDYDPHNIAAIHLVKVHRWCEAINVARHIVLSTVRDLRAVAGSLVRMGWSTTEWHMICAYLDNYVEDAEAWEKDADLVIPYETILSEPLAVIGDLALALGINLEEDQLASVLSVITDLIPANPNPTGNLDSIDERTFLHAGHIGERTNESAVARLPTAMLTKIEIIYGDWLTARGYMPPLGCLANYAEELEQQLAHLKDSALEITELGEVPISFGVYNVPSSLLLFGFDAEEWGAWSVDPLCCLAFRVRPSFQAGDVVLRVGAYIAPGSPSLVATAFLNGRRIDRWLWRRGDYEEIRVPLTRRAKCYLLSFLIESPRSPQSLGVSDDSRELGLALLDIWLEPENLP